jgi:hypothetical protein
MKKSEILKSFARKCISPSLKFTILLARLNLPFGKKNVYGTFEE